MLIDKSKSLPKNGESGGRAELINRGFASDGVMYLVFIHMPDQ